MVIINAKVYEDHNNVDIFNAITLKVNREENSEEVHSHKFTRNHEKIIFKIPNHGGGMHKVCLYYNPVDYGSKLIEMELHIMNENESKDISQSPSHDDINPMYRKVAKIINKVI